MSGWMPSGRGVVVKRCGLFKVVVHCTWWLGVMFSQESRDPHLWMGLCKKMLYIDVYIERINFGFFSFG